MSVRRMGLTEALIDNAGKLAALLQSGITAYLDKSDLPAELIVNVKPDPSVDEVAVIASGER
jgi:hypothetical protein